MKAKLVFILLLVFSFSLSGAAAHHHSRAKYKTKELQDRVMPRSSFNPTIQVDEVNGILLLTFQ